MKSSILRLLSLAFAIGILLSLTNPDESQFLKQVALDYTKLHAGQTINEATLLQMGESTRTSYLILSTYTYEFGNIGVAYFGIASNTFFIRSYHLERKQRDVLI